MFAEIIEGSNIIELIEENANEEGSLLKLVLRVLDNKKWGRMVVSLFEMSSDEESYGLSIRKEYYWDDEQESVAYCWVMMLWGELGDAAEMLGPILEKRAGPPPPPTEAQVTKPGKHHHSILARAEFQKGPIKSETVVRLPHRGAPDRNKKGKGFAKINQRRKGFADAISGDAGDPWDLSHRGED